MRIFVHEDGSRLLVDHDDPCYLEHREGWSVEATPQDTPQGPSHATNTPVGGETPVKPVRARKPRKTAQGRTPQKRG